MGRKKEERDNILIGKIFLDSLSFSPSFTSSMFLRKPLSYRVQGHPKKKKKRLKTLVLMI
jgi:hypothetical protein